MLEFVPDFLEVFQGDGVANQVEYEAVGRHEDRC